MSSSFLLPVFLGVLVSVTTIILVRFVGMTRERSLFPSALIAIASFYVVFAIQAEQTNTIIINVFVTAAFILLSILGFVRSLWLVVFGLIAHGIFDAAYAVSGMSPAPDWWGVFCIAIDVIWGLALAVLIMQKEVRSNSSI